MVKGQFLPDISIRHEGSITLLTPVTERGREWCDTHIDPNHMTWGDAIVVERRYIGAITAGALVDGLRVEA